MPTGHVHQCELCKDCGILGGAETPYIWCGCDLAKRKQIEEPDLIDKANESRQKIEDRFRKKEPHGSR